jgi:hypothetical protein
VQVYFVSKKMLICHIMIGWRKEAPFYNDRTEDMPYLITWRHLGEMNLLTLSCFEFDLSLAVYYYFRFLVICECTLTHTGSQ